MSCYGQRLAAVLQGKVKKMCDWWNIRALTRPQAQCLIAVAFSSKSCLQGALWVDLEKMKMKRRRECEVEKEGRLHRLALRGESRIKLIDSDCWMDWSSPRKYNPLQSSVATRVNIPQQYVHSRRSMYTFYRLLWCTRVYRCGLQPLDPSARGPDTRGAFRFVFWTFCGCYTEGLWLDKRRGFDRSFICLIYL